MPADVITLEAPGLSRPLRIAHVTDAHLCHADPGDPAHLAHLNYVDGLLGGSARWSALFTELTASAPDFIAFTGDLFHSATAANYSRLRQSLSSLTVPWAAT